MLLGRKSREPKRTKRPSEKKTKKTPSNSASAFPKDHCVSCQHQQSGRGGHVHVACGTSEVDLVLRVSAVDVWRVTPRGLCCVRPPRPLTHTFVHHVIFIKLLSDKQKKATQPPTTSKKLPFTRGLSLDLWNMLQMEFVQGSPGVTALFYILFSFIAVEKLCECTCGWPDLRPDDAQFLLHLNLPRAPDIEVWFPNRSTFILSEFIEQPLGLSHQSFWSWLSSSTSLLQESKLCDRQKSQERGIVVFFIKWTRRESVNQLGVAESGTSVFVNFHFKQFNPEAAAGN